MSADVLRRAAALMRERAKAATPGPWEVWEDFDGNRAVYDALDDRHIADVAEWSRGLRNPQHIASWHPAVALAVADWLEVVANRYEALVDTFAPGSRAGAITAAENVTGWTDALAVARAYLGVSS